MPPMIRAPEFFHVVSCTQHTSILRRRITSTTSADLPVILPTFQVATLTFCFISVILLLPFGACCLTASLPGTVERSAGSGSPLITVAPVPQLTARSLFTRSTTEPVSFGILVTLMGGIWCGVLYRPDALPGA